MPEFDPSKAYVTQEEVFFDDGREIDLLHFIYGLPDLESIRGNPEKVLEAIDLFGRTKKYLMNVGEDKGKIVTDLIREGRIGVMVELGGYVGYSAILFGSALRKHSPSPSPNKSPPIYFTLERSPEFAAVILALVSLAGLSDIIHVEIGSSAQSLKRLHSTGQLTHIDLMFLDHYKPAYTSDLKLCEELGLIGKGTVLAADNVIKPGNPPYLEYVRASVAQKKEWVKEQTDGQGGVDERFGARQVQQYMNRVEKEELGKARGKPTLVYESRLVESFEPTGVPDGVEITRCVGEEDS